MTEFLTEAQLNKRVADLLIEHEYKGELTDGQALDAIYDLMSFDDLDDCEKIYCLNELLETIKGRA